jgi:hypothetical protein
LPHTCYTYKYWLATVAVNVVLALYCACGYTSTTELAVENTEDDELELRRDEDEGTNGELDNELLDLLLEDELARDEDDVIPRELDDETNAEELEEDDPPSSDRPSGSPDPPLRPVEDDEDTAAGPPQIAREGRR